jgi:hypothetical protein
MEMGIPAQKTVGTVVGAVPGVHARRRHGVFAIDTPSNARKRCIAAWKPLH